LLDAIAPGMHASPATMTNQMIQKAAEGPDEVVVYVT